MRDSSLPETSSAPLTATHTFPSEPKLNILIPMSGVGRRFKDAGYALPKPLIDVRGKPMIQRVVESLGLNGQHIFIVRSELNWHPLLNTIAPRCLTVTTDVLTEGAACSTLLAKHLICNDTSLIIANADQLVRWDSDRFLRAMEGADAGILTFNATHPKWSYVTTDGLGVVTKVAEKQVISNIATVGIYWYRHGSEYVHYAEQMISKNIRVNGEFYVAPVFNEYILDGKKVVTFPCENMVGLGTPEDLELYLQ